MQRTATTAWVAIATLLAAALLALGIFIGRKPRQRSSQLPTNSRTCSGPRTRAPPKPPPPPAAPAATPAPQLPPSPPTLLDQPGILIATLRTVDPNGALGYLPLDTPPLPPPQPNPTGLPLPTPPPRSLSTPNPPKSPTSGPAWTSSSPTPATNLSDKNRQPSLSSPDNKSHIKQGPIDKISDTRNGHHSPVTARIFSCALAITADTLVTLDGNPAKIADLKYRMLVNATYQGTDAKNIATASTVIMDNAQHHADGILVSAAADLIDIRLYGNPGFDVKLKPAEPFKIQKESGRGNNVTLADATLADLQTGQHVVATYTNGSASDITIKATGGTGTPARRPAGTNPPRTTPPPAPTPLTPT